MGKAIDVNWEEIQLKYQKGGFTCKQLGEQYKVNPVTVSKRCTREGWKVEQQELVSLVSKRTVERLVDERVSRLKEHHSLVVPIAEKLIKSVEKSHDSMPDGLMDPAMIAGLASGLKMANSVALLNLGFVQQQAVDVTSGGLSVHENSIRLLESVRKLHADGKLASTVIDVEGLSRELKESQTDTS